MSLKKLHAKSGVHIAVLCCFLENLSSSIHFLYSDNTNIKDNVWKTSNFLKSDKGLLCTPHLTYTGSFFKFIS